MLQHPIPSSLQRVTFVLLFRTSLFDRRARRTPQGSRGGGRGRGGVRGGRSGVRGGRSGSGSSLARGAATSGLGGGSRCPTDRSTNADSRSSSDADADGEGEELRRVVFIWFSSILASTMNQHAPCCVHCNHVCRRGR